MTAILALDTATGPCSAAIWKDGAIAAYLEKPQPVMQSACLMPMIEEALAQSGLVYHDLTAIAATIGPGSFTGIRVGLATARGIAFASNIKSLGFTTLETVAFAARTQAECILAILNAGKNEVYYQRFETTPRWCTLSDPELGKLEQAMAAANDAHVIGMPTASFPRADVLAELAAMNRESAQSLSPFYIRPPDAKPSTRKA